MKIEDIDVDSSINSVKELLKKEKDLSPTLRSALEVLLLLVALLHSRMTLNSKNRSKPPSTDPNRKKSSKLGQSSRMPGGQKGRNGTRRVKILMQLPDGNISAAHLNVPCS